MALSGLAARSGAPGETGEPGTGDSALARPQPAEPMSRVKPVCLDALYSTTKSAGRGTAPAVAPGAAASAPAAPGADAGQPRPLSLPRRSSPPPRRCRSRQIAA